MPMTAKDAFRNTARADANACLVMCPIAAIADREEGELMKPKKVFCAIFLVGVCVLGGGWYRGRLAFDHAMQRATGRGEYQSTDLTQNVRKGNVQGVRDILNRFTDRSDGFFTASDKEKTPLISIASLRGDVEIVRLLLAAGARPDARCSEGRTALMWAAWSGHIDSARELIAWAARTNGSSLEGFINQTDRHGASALMFASMNVAPGNLRTVRLLLEKGANVDAIDEKGFTALMQALGARRVEVVRELLSAAASIVVGKTAATPFSIAVAAKCAECLEALLAAAEPKQKSDQIKDSLSDAALTAVEVGFIDALKLLASREMLFLDRTGPGGLGVMHAAAKLGRQGALDLLLELGGDVNLRTNESHQTPLMLATNTGVEPAIIRKLVGAGADVNAIDQSGDSALVMAVRRNDFEVTRILLDAQANYEINDRFGQTPLILATRKGNAEMAMLLLDSGANINQKDMNGQTAFVAAIRSGRRAIAPLLAARGVDLESRDKQGMTPLMVAAAEGDDDTVKLLLERGAKPHSRDRFGLNAAARAERAGKTKVSELLK